MSDDLEGVEAGPRRAAEAAGAFAVEIEVVPKSHQLVKRRITILY